MKCPNCGKEMKHICETVQFPDFSGTADDYELLGTYEEYKCKNCKIKYINGKWEIPSKYAPTERQRKTILFINNHLRMNLEALTKHQCWLDIGKYFEEAKKTPLHSDDYWEDMQEFFDMSIGDFC